MTCPDCKHDDHSAGKCKLCPCGESEICHSSGKMRFEDYSFELRPSSLLIYGYNRGRRVPKRQQEE